MVWLLVVSGFCLPPRGIAPMPLHSPRGRIPAPTSTGGTGIRAVILLCTLRDNLAFSISFFCVRLKILTYRVDHRQSCLVSAQVNVGHSLAYAGVSFEDDVPTFGGVNATQSFLVWPDTT